MYLFFLPPLLFEFVGQACIQYKVQSTAVLVPSVYSSINQSICVHKSNFFSLHVLIPIILNYRTIQAVAMEEMALPPHYTGSQDLVKSLLHSIYKKHLVLKNKYNVRRKKHGFQKVLSDAETKITVYGTELYFLMQPSSLSSSTAQEKGKSGDNSSSTDSMQLFKKQDFLTFNLPDSLQPGFRGSDIEYEIEDSGSPILPLFRCLGSAKTIRILSALLCEHRIIFVSKDIEILSACVNACTAMLAQGLLVWRHVQIPVLPPHLLKYLSTSAPFIVGVLDRYAEKVERMAGLKEALYIDLDKGLLKTLHMEDAQKKVPDLLLKKKRKKDTAVEEAARLFTSIIDDEREIWDFVEEKVEEDEDMSKKTRSTWSSKSSSKKETQETNNGDFFKQAELFVRSILPQSIKPSEGFQHDEDSPMYAKITSDERFRGYILSDNERGEELARATLVCLFLELIGDMGMYLTVDQGGENATFRLDVKKFLVRKRQMGAKEDTPLYSLLQRLTRSVMFLRFTESRIADIESSSNQIIINHTPLFALCQKHMRTHRTEFTTQNIRKVVFTTISACPERRLIDGREEVKDRALALTSDKQFEGDEVVALTALINTCKECDRSFAQVMQVIWLRIRDDRPMFWTHPLLGLHLLRNFLLHGVSIFTIFSKKRFDFPLISYRNVKCVYASLLSILCTHTANDNCNSLNW